MASLTQFGFAVVVVSGGRPRFGGRRACKVRNATGLSLGHARSRSSQRTPTGPDRHDFRRALSVAYRQTGKLQASKEWRPPRWLGAGAHVTARCCQVLFLRYSLHRSHPINREACNPKLGVCSKLAVCLLDSGLDRRSLVFLVCAGASAACDFNHDCHGVHSRRKIIAGLRARA